MATSPAEKMTKSGHHNLFDDPRLSDVKIKSHGQEIHAHKSILATNCEYFFKAFTGSFKVAKSDEIDLGEDDDADAVRAAIRHLYDRPYDILIEDDLSPGSGITNDDLIFHINVFIVADKYDIPKLRSLIVNKFKHLMETSWEGPQFAPAMKAICLPSAPKLADGSLQAAAAKFCAEHIDQLVKQKSFKEILEEEEPFAGRLLCRAILSRKGGMTLVCRHCRRVVNASTIQWSKHGAHGTLCPGCSKGPSGRRSYLPFYCTVAELEEMDEEASPKAEPKEPTYYFDDDDDDDI